MTPRKVDLNVDIAEGFPYDHELLEIATSANIGCGVHAGSEQLTKETVARCRDLGVRVGIHPGYPDRESMGRAAMTVDRQREWLKSVFDQVEWFRHAFGADYLKPHGAFYNETAIVLPGDWEIRHRKRPETTRYEAGGTFLSMTPGIQSLGMMLRVHKLPLLGLPGTAHSVVAQRAGIPFVREGFADRVYQPDGTLVPRSQKGSQLTNRERIAEQVLELANRVDSICLHGDRDDCVELAWFVRATLENSGYEVGY